LRARRLAERIGDQKRAAEDSERDKVTKSLCARSLLHFKRSALLRALSADAKLARCRANVTL